MSEAMLRLGNKARQDWHDRQLAERFAMSVPIPPVHNPGRRALLLATTRPHAVHY